MDIEYRMEQPSDYRETEAMTREAFWNHFAPGCDEHYLLHIMRDCPSFVPELDMVAVHEGKIVGNAVSMKSVIQGDNGKEYEVLTLGPLSVLPSYQKKGIGSQLIEYTRRKARKMGFAAILLCGDPDYYSRQGFAAAETLGIRMAGNVYAAALQVSELYENALCDAKGLYMEDTIYEIDKASAEEFDQHFPAKERVTGTPSQKRFDEIVCQVTPYSDLDGRLNDRPQARRRKDDI